MESVEILNVVWISKFVLLLKISCSFLFQNMSWNNIDLVYWYKYVASGLKR